MADELGLRPGTRLGRHVVLEGASGSIVAWDPELEREVEVELFPPTWSVERARLAVQPLAAVEHPLVAAVYDVGVWRERAYVTVERVMGEPIAEWRRRVSGTNAALRVLGDLAQGLAVAHRAGVVHGRLDAAAMIVDGDARPRLIGFALGRADVPDGATEDQRAFCALAVAVLAQERGQVPLTLRWFGGRQLAAALRRGRDPDPGKRWPSMGPVVDAFRRARQGRTRWRAAGVAAMLAAGLSFAALESAPADPCVEVDAAVDQVWNDDRAASLSVVFDSTGLLFASDTAARVAEALDEFAAGWSDVARRVCVAASADEAEPELHQRQQTCLQRRLAEADALLAVFEGADEGVVKRATDAVARLRPARACLEPATLPPEVAPADPARAQNVERIEAAVLQAKALGLAGRFGAAVQAAAQARRRAEATEHVPTILAATLAMGELANDAGHFEQALVHLEQAIWLGLRIGDHGAVASAAATAIRAIADSDADLEAATFWNDLASAAARRGRLGDGAELDRLNALGSLHAQRRDHRQAQRMYRRALELTLQTHGEGSVNEAIVRHNLGLALYLQSEFEARLDRCSSARSWCSSSTTGDGTGPWRRVSTRWA